MGQDAVFGPGGETGWVGSRGDIYWDSKVMQALSDKLKYPIRHH